MSYQSTIREIVPEHDPRTIWDAWITAVEAELGRDLDDVEIDLANEGFEDDLTPAEFADAVLIAAQEREEAV